MHRLLPFILALGLFQACQNPATKSTESTTDINTFAYDYTQLKAHTPLILLEDGDHKVLLAEAYQGRVMTSTAAGMKGTSYGWINHDLISKGEYQPHMNAFGGEERFWLGPEGGQYGLYFKKGDPFDLVHWQTPGAIDTMTYPAVQKDKTQALFAKSFSIENYAGTRFDLKVERRIRLLSEKEASDLLQVPLNAVKWVGYESDNQLSNTGQEDWDKSKGVLSIWLLGMLKASPAQVVMLPYKAGGSAQVNDAYFGKIAADRLIKKDSVLFFKGDAKSRGKIGIPPAIVKPLAGSYDVEKGALTIVRFSYTGDTAYVNSMWEIQRYPYRGDVVNTYNDGPNDKGEQMGAFYELETSSPALVLKKGGAYRHVQQTFHFEGKASDLNVISKHVLGVELSQVPKF
ncbi:MAG: DUF6786 family protein [Haliscomenobacter sp.]|uniref:DUF6786 family protein n=1 Tax=Haliscomenobacter sp. TaxID=2717303 RepID=UPI0029B90842|nr:DUF6786 family protein [Haliscomenobacter sp.]MDX2069129.1 DUF6786 family protein [Haliscomenobacter sp.]